MRFITSQCAIAISLVAVMSHVTACAQETSTSLRSQGNEIIFANPEQGAWTKLYYSNNHLRQQLFPEKNIYFDESNDSDFSKNKKYLKINKVSQGTIEIEGGEEEYERAYCAFIEMSSGCIVRQETGSFCGGAWAETESTWIWAGEEIVIDERDPQKGLTETDLEMLSEIGGTENIDRCTSQKIE